MLEKDRANITWKVGLEDGSLDRGNFTGKVAKIVSQGPKIRLHFL